jgi:hypothetical protein
VEGAFKERSGKDYRKKTLRFLSSIRSDYFLDQMEQYKQELSKSGSYLEVDFSLFSELQNEKRLERFQRKPGLFSEFNLSETYLLKQFEALGREWQLTSAKFQELLDANEPIRNSFYVQTSRKKFDEVLSDMGSSLSELLEREGVTLLRQKNRESGGFYYLLRRAFSPAYIAALQNMIRANG